MMEINSLAMLIKSLKVKIWERANQIKVQGSKKMAGHCITCSLLYSGGKKVFKNGHNTWVQERYARVVGFTVDISFCQTNSMNGDF